MKLSWKERTPVEKGLFIAECVLALAFLVYMAISIATKKEMSDVIYLIIAIESAIETIVQWKHERKTAIFSLLVAVSSAAVFILSVL